MQSSINMYRLRKNTFPINFLEQAIYKVHLKINHLTPEFTCSTKRRRLVRLNALRL